MSENCSGFQKKLDGIRKWFASLQSAQKAIDEFEISSMTKFIIYYRRASAHPFKKPCIHWSFDDGSPYVLVETTVFECQHGKDRNKIKNNNRKRKLKCYNLESKTTGRREGGTKKKNCPAVIRMMEVVKFPQFQVEELTDVNKSRSRIKLMQELLFSSGTVLKESAWLVVFPNCNEHIGHAVGNKVLSHHQFGRDSVFKQIKSSPEERLHLFEIKPGGNCYEKYE